MLKHKDIIEKLNNEQKIALVTDTRDGYGSALEQYDIPATNLSELWDENNREGGEPLFPSPSSLANSWDENLFGGVAKCLASVGAGYGDNLFLLPSASAASSVYGAELSEEPHLSGALVAGMAKKLKEAGVPYCIKEPICSKNDARFLDKEADLSVMYDRYARPYKMVQGVGGALAVMRSDEEAGDTYKEANELMSREFISKDLNRLVQVKDADTTASNLVKGYQLLGGSTLVLSTALENYERIYRSMEEGGATAHELNMTLQDGAAISKEMLDSAVDKKIELAKKCSAPFIRESEGTIEHVAYEASKRSIVLVKNANKSLPLRKKEKIAICGDIISDEENSSYKGFKDKLEKGLSSLGISVAGFERGYNINENISREMIEPSAKLAATVGTTVAFVGLGAQRERALVDSPHLALPGNQVAMLTQLRRSSKKLIVVICGERLPDMSFDVMADAILLVPPQGAFVAKALADILGGSACPSGRLAYAAYSGVDTLVREHQKRKSTGKLKIGPFVGYRYTDSNGEWTKYPMGFGLSYTSFEYTRLSLDRHGNASVTVRNSGRMEGSEAVQIYVAVPSSNKLRPRKELKGFAQVKLKAGERKTVTIPLGGLDVYDIERGKTVIEAGNYDVHAGTNANSIYLSRRINLIGATLEKEGRHLSDYLQNVSNIVSENYTMEAYCKPMNTKSKLKSFGFILLLATIFADVIYVLSGQMFELPLLDPLYLIVCGATNGVFLILSLISILVGRAREKHVKRIVEKQEMEATKELFKTVKAADVTAIDQLFADEFDMSLEASHKKEIILDEKDDSTYTYMAVDTDIPTLCKDLLAHFQEYGILLTPKTARRILSALMTSRLLIVRNTLGASGERIVEILSRFFGSAPHTDKLGGAKWERQSLLRYNDQLTLDRGSRIAPLMQAINSALSDGEKATFCGVDGARYEDLGNMLMPYVQYFGNPEIEHRISDGAEFVTMPSNLWIVVAPCAEQSLDDLPAFIANLACVVDIEGQTVQEAPNKTARKYITCHQIEALIFRAKKNAQIDENVWKGVDSLESFVSEKTPYHIGNKLFLQLEKYMAVYSKCEEDLNEAMDCAVAAKLIPGVLNILKGNEGMAETDLAQVIESIFGEEYSIASVNTVKRLVLSRETVNIEKKAEEKPKAENAKEEKKDAEPVKEEAKEPSKKEAPIKEEAMNEASVKEEAIEVNEAIEEKVEAKEEAVSSVSEEAGDKENQETEGESNDAIK
ncbi:MAG: glycoside hydrolase family 3 C-terminal domain-containing protein [Clostridia bacterium]|nr:glycoside hydrolase family 3 C-terminal domain-containing protein [Clostridia bacterium]